MGEKTRVHAIIEGRVQGVCFRMATQKKAQRIGVTGWVRNKSDGTVEAVFEGDENAVQSVLDWCRQGGPPSGRVDDMKLERQEYQAQFPGFNIRY